MLVSMAGGGGLVTPFSWGPIRQGPIQNSRIFLQDSLVITPERFDLAFRELSKIDRSASISRQTFKYH